MDSGPLVQSLVLTLVTWLMFFDKYCTQLFTYRPVVIGPIVGLIMGNFEIGLQVGCIVELMFLGQVFVGTALPPEETFSTIIATAFACIANSTEVALATALPLAVIAQMGMYFRNMVLCVWTGHRLEAAVERHDLKGITMNCLVLPNVFNLVLFALPVFLAVYFGADLVQGIINVIPQSIITGLAVGGNMIGAVGLSLLMKSINFSKMWYFFLIGFFFASYLGIGNIGITMLAVICVAAAFYADRDREEQAALS